MTTVVVDFFFFFPERLFYLYLDFSGGFFDFMNFRILLQKAHVVRGARTTQV